MATTRSTRVKIEILVIELVIVCALLGFLFMRKVESFTLPENTIYFYNTVDYSIPSDSKIILEDDKDMIVRVKGGSDYNAISVPLYSEDLKRIYTTKELAYYDINFSSTIPYRMNYFTTGEKLSDKALVKFTKNENARTVENGFLYDGENTFIFLERMVLTVNHREYELDPFSYAIVNKNNNIIFFDITNNEHHNETISDEPTAKALNDLYTIMLASDIIKRGNDNIMLQSNIYNFDSFFEGVSEQ